MAMKFSMDITFYTVIGGIVMKFDRITYNNFPLNFPVYLHYDCPNYDIPINPSYTVYIRFVFCAN